MSELKRRVCKILKEIGIDANPENVLANRFRGSSATGFYVKANHRVNNDNSESYRLLDCYYTLTEFVKAYREFGAPEVCRSTLTFPKNVNGKHCKHFAYEPK